MTRGNLQIAYFSFTEQTKNHNWNNLLAVIIFQTYRLLRIEYWGLSYIFQILGNTVYNLFSNLCIN